MVVLKGPTAAAAGTDVMQGGMASQVNGSTDAPIVPS